MTKTTKRLLDRRQFGAGLAAAFAAPAYLAGCARAEADVLVVGAGLAGLNATLLLQEYGVSVVLAEASQRVGGRVRTLDDVTGRPEGGGSEVGPLYARVRDAAGRYGLGLIDAALDPIRFAVSVDNAPLIDYQAWADSDQNPFEGELRALPPFALASRFLPKENPLASLDSWLEPDAHQWDIPYTQFLREQGATAKMIELIDVGIAADSPDLVSYLWILRQRKIAEASMAMGGLQFIEGGMSRLPEAMANDVAAGVRFGHELVAIEHGGSRVKATFANGNTITARACVLAAPLTALREIDFEPALSAPVDWALRSIPYGQGTSLFLPIKAPYWEEDGLPSSIWTNGDLPRVFKWGSPKGEFLWVYISGKANEWCRDETDAAIAERVLTTLHELRPSTKGRVELGAVVNWSANPLTRGTFAHRAPGQIKSIGTVLSELHGNLAFAGEHNGAFSAGLEGAMESGEQAANLLLERLG